MRDIAGNDETVTRSQLISFVSTDKPKATTSDIGRLHVWMAVQLALGPSLEAKRHNHQLRRFGKDLPLDTLIGRYDGKNR